MPYTPPTGGDPLLLTLDHASWHLGAPVGPAIEAGELPVVRLRGRLFVRRVDLEAWVSRLVPEAAVRSSDGGAVPLSRP